MPEVILQDDIIPERVIPAQRQRPQWRGSTGIELKEGDTISFKVFYNGVELPPNPTYTVTNVPEGKIVRDVVYINFVEDVPTPVQNPE